MPIYEYACENCGNKVDVFQKMDDPAPAKCEKCGAEGKMTRQVSRTSFVLKGGGWYSDLYGSSKKDSSATPAGTTGSTTSTTPSTAPSTTPSTSGGSSGSGSGSGSS